MADRPKWAWSLGCGSMYRGGRKHVTAPFSLLFLLPAPPKLSTVRAFARVQCVSGEWKRPNSKQTSQEVHKTIWAENAHLPQYCSVQCISMGSLLISTH